ncbi:MAG: hypothetical protein GX488_04575 [Clostridiales bacterium]|nr:hypothetical protein [Clostridiales bacterium]
MTFDKDLGFADRYIIVDTPTLKITKLVYKGSFAKLGEQTITRVYDKNGYVVEEANVFNGTEGHISVSREITDSSSEAKKC